jgi:hypothetical protein
MPNNTGDGSGALRFAPPRTLINQNHGTLVAQSAVNPQFCRYSFLADAREHNVGSVVAPSAPTFVVHSEMDELVPVADCRKFCEDNSSIRGGCVQRYVELPPRDSRGEPHDHSLYNWAKHDSACELSMEKVMKEWFLLQ